MNNPLNGKKARPPLEHELLMRLKQVTHLLTMRKDRLPFEKKGIALAQRTIAKAEAQ